MRGREGGREGGREREREGGREGRREESKAALRGPGLHILPTVECKIVSISYL